MACNITLSGIAYYCDVNLSGVKEIYIADWNSFNDASVGTDGVISAITMDSSAKFQVYVPAKNTGSLTKTLTKDEGTGVRYYTNEVTAQFNHMDSEKREELSQLDGGQLVAMVLDNNGIYWFLGLNNWVSCSAVTGQTGAGIDDGNFYTITLTDISAGLPHEVAASAAKAVIDTL